MKTPNSQRGSLLINLLVSLGIIALLATISIPYLRKYQPNLKLNGAARDLTSDLRYAQQLTVTEQKIHLVSFNPLAGNYDILKIDAATTTVKTVALDSDINFKQITGLNNNQVIFNYYGGVSQPGQVILTNINGIDAAINIKPSGYIQLVE
ncbi:MAG: hypothetical protein Q8O93_01310 [bacterium]|nr:hypothetical protein [bacterium]